MQDFGFYVIKGRLAMQSMDSFLHEVTDARGTFITHFSNFCKNKFDNGWLAETEDPKKLKESLTNIVTIVNRCYNKSWCLR